MAAIDEWEQPISQLPFHATEAVRQALRDIGRTEDLRFSPSNRLVALAGFKRRVCLILRIDIEDTPSRPRIVLSDFMTVAAETLAGLHGIDFIDDETVVLADRFRRVSILRLPAGDLGGRHCEIEPIRIRGSLFQPIRSSGSIAVRREATGEISLLVCNNYTHKVTRHVLTSDYHEKHGEVLLARGMNVPDGIALSHDGRWIAVSSHNDHDVKIFAADAPLGPKTEPVGILRDAAYPHGLRFTADDRHLLLADAGAPLVRVYQRGEDWTGTRQAVRSLRVLDEASYLRGRFHPTEGGPKGIDMDRRDRIVAVSCKEQPLAFFSMAAVLGNH